MQPLMYSTVSSTQPKKVEFNLTGKEPPSVCWMALMGVVLAYTRACVCVCVFVTWWVYILYCCVKDHKCNHSRGRSLMDGTPLWSEN